MFGRRPHLPDESSRCALNRHIHETLGTKLKWIAEEPTHPLHVAEYFSIRVMGALYDPRQRAIASTFAVEIRGPIEVRAEALDFKGFDRIHLPTAQSFGLG